jgi:hypothetical protein
MEKTFKAKIVYLKGAYALGGKQNYMWIGVLLDPSASDNLALWFANPEKDEGKRKRLEVKEVEVTIKS